MHSAWYIMHYTTHHSNDSTVTGRLKERCQKHLLLIIIIIIIIIIYLHTVAKFSYFTLILFFILYNLHLKIPTGIEVCKENRRVYIYVTLHPIHSLDMLYSYTTSAESDYGSFLHCTCSR